MTTLTTAIQQAIEALEKGDVLCEIKAAHILRQAMEAAKESLARSGLTAIRLAREGDQQAAETLRAQQDRIAELESQLAAIGAGGVQPLRKRECLHQIGEPYHFRDATKMVQSGAPVVPVANCYSDDDGDRWRDRPDDCEFVEGRALGEEFELQASIRSWTEVFRVTKVPDENSDDYEVEPVSMRTTSAPQAQADARGALEEAASVLSSINKWASHEVTVGDEVCYWQRKEWIDWAEKEVLPKVRAAIDAAIAAQGGV